MTRSIAIARVAAALLTGACAQGGAAPPPAAPPPADTRAREPRVAPTPRDAEWGRLRVVARSLELDLPELSAWRYEAGQSWIRLEHAPSDSILELWVARAERLVRPADCEARARLARPDLWKPLPETTIEHGSLDVPPGFRTELTVGIAVEPGDPFMHGHLVAFGAAPGRCLAVHFKTRVEGENAGAELARRLDLIATRSVPSLTLRGVEDRVAAPPAR